MEVKAYPKKAPTWVQIIFPDEVLTPDLVATRTELVAFIWGLMVFGIVFFLPLGVTALILSGIGMLLPAGILAIVALAVATYSGYRAWKVCRTGFDATVETSHQGVMSAAGTRIQRLALEGKYTFPRIRFPFGIADNKFALDIGRQVPMMKITHDIENNAVMSRSLGGMKAKASVGIRTRTGAKHVYLRSQYTDEQVKGLILDEINTALGITTKRGTAKDYAQKLESGEDGVERLDFLNEELHKVLHSSNFSDMERIATEDSRDLYHKKLGTYISPYFIGHSWTNQKTADGVEEVTRAEAKADATEKKLRIIADAQKKLTEIYGKKLSGEEARRIILIITDEFTEEKIHDFFGMAGPDAVKDIVSEAIAKIGGKKAA